MVRNAQGRVTCSDCGGAQETDTFLSLTSAKHTHRHLDTSTHPQAATYYLQPSTSNHPCTCLLIACMNLRTRNVQNPNCCLTGRHLATQVDLSITLTPQGDRCGSTELMGTGGGAGKRCGNLITTIFSHLLISTLPN